MADQPVYLPRMEFEFRDAGEDEPFLNYLGFLEVEPSEDVQVTNAFAGGTLAGSIVYDVGQSEGGCVWIRHIYVKPEFRGQGLGRELADCAIYDALWHTRSTGGHYLVEGDWTLPWLQDWFARRLEEAAKTHPNRGRWQDDV